jgi:tellurite resistance protein
MNLRSVLPASLFGSVLGLSGLANDWRAAHQLWQFPLWPGECIAVLAVAAWLACVTLYTAKWFLQKHEALEELNHPIQCCFIALIPVSTMLVGLTLLHYWRPLAMALYLVGATAAVAFSVWRQGGLLQGARDLNTATPVLYLPSVAANFVAAIGAGAFDWVLVAQVFFGAGLLSWLAIESVLLHRLLHAEPLSPGLRPTFGVQLAPPAVGLVALIAATGSPPPLMASVLMGYGVLQVLLVVRLLAWLLEGGFGAGFWSFTFGITALALGAEKLALDGHPLARWLAPLLFMLANGVVGAIAVRSVWLIARGKLLPQLVPASKQ